MQHLEPVPRFAHQLVYDHDKKVPLITNNNNITSIELKSSGIRAQKHIKTESLIISFSRHTGDISVRGHDYSKWKSNFEKIRFEIFTERNKTFIRF